MDNKVYIGIRVTINIMDEIAHKYRKTFERGGSVAITIPPEAGFKAGEGAAWRIEDDKLILSKATITNKDIRYTQVDRERRKHALYDEIKHRGNLVTEEYLIARFAIDNQISKDSVCDYRDELLAEMLIVRIAAEEQSDGATLQAL